eukprot:scaffold70459_cov30-Prasinocladus_malaysianus.AAC.1
MPIHLAKSVTMNDSMHNGKGLGAKLWAYPALLLDLGGVHPGKGDDLRLGALEAFPARRPQPRTAPRPHGLPEDGVLVGAGVHEAALAGQLAVLLLQRRREVPLMGQMGSLPNKQTNRQTNDS